MDLDGFFARCARLMQRRAELGRPLSEARLSTILFSSGPRLARLRAKRRIFQATLEQAEAALAKEEAKLERLAVRGRRMGGSLRSDSRRKHAGPRAGGAHGAARAPRRGGREAQP